MPVNIENVIPTIFNTQNVGVCNRCQEHRVLNAHGLCETCDEAINEEYKILYQESLEVDFN